MNILVTGAGSRIGQAIIRLIKKKNKSFLIFSTDYLKDSIVLLSIIMKFYPIF